MLLVRQGVRMKTYIVISQAELALILQNNGLSTGQFRNILGDVAIKSDYMAQGTDVEQALDRIQLKRPQL